MDFEKIESLSDFEIKELYKNIIEDYRISVCCGSVTTYGDDFGCGPNCGSGCELRLYSYASCTSIVSSRKGYSSVNCFTDDCWCYKYGTYSYWYSC